MYSQRNIRRRRLICEQLEARLALSGVAGGVPAIDATSEQGVFHAVIVAGEAPDSPAARIDSNTDLTPFDGVGSITIAARRGNYICTGTPIDDTHVVTAAHCVDINNDGKSNNKDGITSITFNLNYGGNYSSRIGASSWVTHPDFTGFNRPAVNDDVAVLTLSQPIPAGVPTYGLFTGSLSGQIIDLVGYGQSGDGINGYTVSASYTAKRAGKNVVDAFYAQDDASRPAANEVFRFDFDRDNGTTGPLGGASLDNLVETTLGGGDSGGPSFVQVGESYLLAGVNTFSQSTASASAPKFGSMGGGMSIPAYASWISQVVAGAAASTAGGASGGRGATGDSAIRSINFAMDDAASAVLAMGFETAAGSATVRAVGPTVGRAQDAVTLDRTAAAPFATLAAAQDDLIGNGSLAGRLRSLAEEPVGVELSEFERIAAVDAYHT